jgi:succinoglycan biosynthesis transport protein ExoP
MTFRQFLRIIRARKRAVLATLVAFLVLAIALTLLLPKRYTASASVLVDFKAVDPVLGNYMPAHAVPGYVATQVDIIQSRAVALKVVNALRLADNAAIRQQYLDDSGGRGRFEDWLADLLLKKLDVRPSRESSVVEISYSSPDPKFAAAMANAFAQAYIDENLDLKMFPAQKTAIWFDKQMGELRKNLERAQARVLQYQQDKGIVAVDERLDVESARLSELTNELVRSQTAVYDNQSRANQLNEFLVQNKNPDSLPEVLASPLINTLKSQLALSEAKLNQLGAQLGRGHPEYQRVEAEVEGLRRKLTEEIKAVYTGITNSARIAQAREAEQRAAVQRQKTRLLELNRGRDEMSVLVKELDNAYRAFEAAGARYTQSTLEGRNDQLNISILSLAAEPAHASFPRFGLNITIGILLGAFIGIAVAVFRETLDRRVRTPQDLVDALQIAVLGVLHDNSEKTSWWARKKPWVWARTRSPAT